jgi:hypothetical protein
MKNIAEGTTSANVERAEFSFNKVVEAFTELPTLSLMRSVAAIVPMSMPTGSIINLRKTAAGIFETVEADLTVNTSTSNPIQTGLSKEVAHDLFRQYGIKAYDVVAELLKGVVDEAEDTALFTFLDANSTNTAALTLSSASNAETSLFEITQRVQELVLKMNTPQYRTYDAFVILPYTAAATISALTKYIGQEENQSRLIVSKIGKTTYYVNPSVSATKAYVGLHSNGEASSSIIVGDYQREILTSTFVESFQDNIAIVNRYATAVNPLSTSGKEMLMEFTIS